MSCCIGLGSEVLLDKVRLCLVALVWVVLCSARLLCEREMLTIFHLATLGVVSYGFHRIFLALFEVFCRCLRDWRGDIRRRIASAVSYVISIILFDLFGTFCHRRYNIHRNELRRVTGVVSNIVPIIIIAYSDSSVGVATLGAGYSVFVAYAIPSLGFALFGIFLGFAEIVVATLSVALLASFSMASSCSSSHGCACRDNRSGDARHRFVIVVSNGVVMLLACLGTWIGVATLGVGSSASCCMAPR